MTFLSTQLAASQRPNKLSHECGKVARPSGRDEIAINNYFGVLVDCAGGGEFLGERSMTGDAPIAEQAR